MTAKEYYEKQRVLGLTENITSNPNPNYREPFYENIFFLMESYANFVKQKAYERGIEDGKTIQEHGTVNWID